MTLIIWFFQIFVNTNCSEYYINVLTSLMRNDFPKRPSREPRHTLLILYNNPVGYVTPIPLMRLCIALFAVAERWLMLDIGCFVLFLLHSLN